MLPFFARQRRDRRNKNQSRYGRIELLERRSLLTADFVISEFMAINDETLVDSDGDSSDWIEIHNPTDAIKNLEGWFLTDRAGDLNKWEFPPVSLGSGEFMIVFASAKDRLGEELHTNFRLSGTGEYLALVQPDESTITTEYDSYPVQLSDVAYGLDGTAQPTPLVTPDGPVSIFVPTDNALGSQWQQRGFDDNDWRTGMGGVGYGLESLIGLNTRNEMLTVSPSAFVRSTFQVSDAGALDTLSLDIQYDDGFVAYLNGEEIAQRNALLHAQSPASGLVSYWDFNGTLADSAGEYQNNSGIVDDDLIARGGAARYEAGLRGEALAIGVQNGDTTDLAGALTDDVKLPPTYTIEAWVKPTELSDSWQRLVLNWGAEQAYHFAIRNNSGFSNAVSLFHAQGNGQQPNANGGTVTLNEWQHVAGVADGTMLRVYLNGVEVDAVPYDGTIHTVAGEGLGIGDSFGSLSSIKFNGLIDELAIWEVPLTAEQLQSHFLAGSEGYGLLAPGASVGLGWDTVAAEDRPSSESAVVETIDVSNFVEFIEPGENVLAIHGLNVASTSQEFLIRSGLTASTIEIDPAAQRYYPAATPGAANAVGFVELGPIIDDVQHQFLPPTGITTTILIDANSNFQAFVPADDSLDLDWIEPDYQLGFHGESWTEPASGGVGFDVETTYDALIGTNLHDDMLNRNATAYIRSEFDLSDANVADDRLSLNIRYDDGFVAYLNGVEVARRNAPVSTNSPNTGLATYYSFDGDIDDHASDFENSASTVEDDFSALAASGVVNVSYGTGRDGQAVRISRGAGEAAMLTATDSNDLDLSANWTVEAFVKPDASNTGEWDRFATKWHPDGNSWHWAFRGANNGIDLFLNGDQVIHHLTTATVPLDEWSHVAITGNLADRTIEAWLNGVKVASQPYRAVLPGNAPLTLGNFVLGDAPLQYSGLIDEFAIWEVALTGDQLLNHATRGSYDLTPAGGQPTTDHWQAAATGEQLDEVALVSEIIDISQFAEHLRSGKNVLAIHGLNVDSDDGDFLILPELIAESGSDTDGPLLVTAAVRPSFNSVSQTTLTYRSMFDDESSLFMVDDGTGDDAVAGDGIFTARIRGGASKPGEMLRYYVTAADTADTVSRAPAFSHPSNSAEYFGTIVADPSIETALPLLHRFIQDTAAAETRSGTRGSIFYDGEFYDNVFIRIRGGTAVSWPKKSYKIEFNDDHHFRFRNDAPRVDEFNLNTTYTDKSYVRAILAYDTHDAVGSPAPETFAMHVRQNGEFFSVAHFVEQPDRDFLRRHNLDPDGSLYKGNANPTNGFVGSAASGAFEKKTRKDEGFDDLQGLIDGLALTGDDLETYLFDNIDLAAQVNFMAVNVIMQNIDATDKNFYIYRDTEGDGEWQMLPWDLDLVYGPNALNTDTIVHDEDRGPAHTSHPYLGTLDFPFHGRKNHLFHAIINNPRTNEMFLRRVRTLMDEILATSDTAVEKRFVERRIDELISSLGPDVLLDRERWGRNAHFGGRTDTLEEATDRIKNEYLEPRRTHLFETHSIDAGVAMEVTLWDEGATKAAFVPTDDSLGLAWTQIDFNDSQWLVGTDSVGFDRGTTYDELIGIDLLAANIPSEQRIDTDGNGTNETDSVYIRIPFQIQDPSRYDQLRLKVRFDDGFIAYLNGVEIARSNAPDAVTWNSSATTNRFDFLGTIVQQEFDVVEFSHDLVAGNNVLAFHALTDATGGVGRSDRMILNATLLDGFPPQSEPVGIPRKQPSLPSIEFGQFDVSPESGDQDQEFIELFNDNDFAVDISNWRLTGGVEYAIQPGTVIPAGDRLYLTPHLPAFRSRTTGPSGNSRLFAQGPYAGHLSSFGETIELRTDDGILMAMLNTPAEPSDVQRYLRISEVHYNPVGDGVEFIELTHSGVANTPALDLSDVTWTDGPSQPFVIPDGTLLSPSQYLVITNDADAFRAAYPEVEPNLVLGPFFGSLANGGERLKVDDARGNTAVDFAYDDSDLWPQAADGVGASLELSDPLLPTSDHSKPTSWRSSSRYGGTPGAPRIEPAGIVISEVLAHTDPPVNQSDSIELYNPTSRTIDVGGWYLSDSRVSLLKFRIPDGTVVGPGDFVVFDEDDFNPTPLSPAANHFALSGTLGDDVWLVIPVNDDRVAQFVDDVHFGPTENGQSLGLASNSNGRIVPTTRTTLGCGIGRALVADVVVNEIHYAPGTPSAAALALAPHLDNNDLEFIEIRAAETGQDYSGWRIRGGIDFDFTDGSMAAAHSVIVTSFDPHAPANADRLAAFREQYGLSDSVRLVGGYSGSLSNVGEQIRLERPMNDPLTGLDLFLTVDEVIYDMGAPWPTLDGTSGQSIHRKSPIFLGNDGVSWIAASPSPGNPLLTQDSVTGDFDNDQQVTAADIDLLLDAIGRGSRQEVYAVSGAEVATSTDVEFLVNTIFGTHLGDTDLNGVVDAADLNQIGLNWQRHECQGWSKGDFTGDWRVTAADLNILGLNWQQGLAATSEPTARIARSALGGTDRVTLTSGQTQTMIEHSNETLSRTARTVRHQRAFAIPAKPDRLAAIDELFADLLADGCI